MSITKTELIAAIFNCGTADVDNLLKEFENFDVDMYEVFNNCTYRNLRNYNAVVETIYCLAIDNVLEELGLCNFPDDIKDSFEISVNFIDSRIFGINKAGDSMEIYDKNDLETFLRVMMND